MKLIKLQVKVLTISFLLCILNLSAFCQVSVIEKGKDFKVYDHYKLIDTLHPEPGQLEKVHHVQRIKQLMNDHYYYEFPYAGNLGIKFDNGPVKSEVYEGLNWGLPYFNKSIIIDGDCAIELAAQEINEGNAANYRYRVVQNGGKELVTWTIPSVFKYTSDKRFKYAWLGKFNYEPGQVLKVEIYNIKNIKQQDAMLIDWRKVEAAKISGNFQFFTKKFRLPDNGLYAAFFNEIKHPIQKRHFEFNGKQLAYNKPASESFIETTSPDDIKFRLGDSLQNISFVIDNGKRLYNYRVILNREIDGQTDRIDLGETNSNVDLYKEFWKNPGKYKLTFTPKIYKHGGQPIKLLHNLATSISFTVLPALNEIHNVSRKTVAWIVLIIFTTGGFMFSQYRANQKRKLYTEAKNREIVTLQLQSVRSQLNPHFMFNALAGIQNMMNKNEIELANKYLARFARITRNVLDNGNKELTTVEQEVDLLTDYLQMEQMRFGFKYTIYADSANIDQQIEIPAMLLQPFVENAVKHGVSALKDKGMITVSITRKDTSVVLMVEDNGKGFTESETRGMGTKLCEDRIKLLNSIYKNSTILLRKNSGSGGTIIIIELKNWL